MRKFTDNTGFNTLILFVLACIVIWLCGCVVHDEQRVMGRKYIPAHPGTALLDDVPYPVLNPEQWCVTDGSKWRCGGFGSPEHAMYLESKALTDCQTVEGAK